VPEPTDPKMPRIIAIANQKGGVGKTTTAINLGAALAELGRHVLLIDLDPQGNASTGLGIGVEDRRKTAYDLLLSGDDPCDIVLNTGVERLSIVPSTADLTSADIELYKNEDRLCLLRNALRRPSMKDHSFDYILIDCPPSLNLLTVNAMVAADSVMAPLQCEFLALEGLSQLVLTLREVRRTANPALRFEGVVLTMYDGRNKLSQQVEKDARENLGELVFRTIIPRNVRIGEAPSFAVPVLDHDSNSRGSQAYRALATELTNRHAGIAE